MECKKCGLTVPDDSAYCNYCGEKLTDEADTAALQPSGKKKKEVKGSLPAFALILGALSVNIIGIVLAAVSLLKFCNFERAVLMKEALASSKLSASSKKYAVCSIIISLLSVVFTLVFIGLMIMTMIREPDIMSDFAV